MSNENATCENNMSKLAFKNTQNKNENKKKQKYDTRKCDNLLRVGKRGL